MKKTLISLTLCASMLMPALSVFGLRAQGVQADGTSASATPRAELTLSPNGTTGIVSMTFDDGDLSTARWLNEKFKQYDLYGSTMLITGKNLATEENTDAWRELYADGRLHPECHTMTHMPLPNESWSSYEQYKDNNTEQNYENEIHASGQMLQEVFGTFPLCIAPSNNTMSPGGMQYVQKYYYAMRQGSRYGTDAIQSLDPVPGSSEKGGWYNLLMSGTKNAEEKILSGLQIAANDGGWLVVMCHGIHEDSGDSTYEKFEQVLSAMSSYQESGRVWVATFGDATKYIRERQNTSVLFERGADASYSLSLSMRDVTEDGLALSADVFNLALTVRVTLPEGATHLVYDLGEGEVRVEGVDRDGERCALVNLVPNRDMATVRFVDGEGRTVISHEELTLLENVSYDDTFTYNLYVKKDTTLIGASVDGTYVSADALGEAEIDGEGYYKLSHRLPLFLSPRAFEVALYTADALGREGACTLSSSVLTYFSHLFSQSTAQPECRRMALEAMLLLRDISVSQKLGVDTSCVYDAILEEHYRGEIPDALKNAVPPDISSLADEITYELSEGVTVRIVPKDGRDASRYRITAPDGTQLDTRIEDGAILLSVTTTNPLLRITVSCGEGDEVTTLSYGFADAYAELDADAALADVYASFYRFITALNDYGGV